MWESDCPFQDVVPTRADGIGPFRDRLGIPAQDDRRWLHAGTSVGFLSRPVEG